MPISSSTETANIWNNGDVDEDEFDSSSEEEKELKISTAVSGDEDFSSSGYLMTEDSINVYKKRKSKDPMKVKGTYRYCIIYTLVTLLYFPIVEMEPLNSPIVRYFYDVRSMGKSCPSQICRYAKSDWRTLMIMCEKCEQWYHTMCVKLLNHRARTLLHYICPTCRVDSMEESFN